MFQDVYEYVYDENVAYAGEDKGQRLVGASRGEVKDSPFLVGFNLAAFNTSFHFSTCTG